MNCSSNLRAELAAVSPDDRIISGTSSAIIDRIGQYVEAGVERFMLQWLKLDDMAGLELIARDVMTHYHK
jgi:hypothetical protein